MDKQKPISSKKLEWRFCQDFWTKIYSQDGGIYNFGQNRRHRSLQKQGEHYLCWSVFVRLKGSKINVMLVCEVTDLKLVSVRYAQSFLELQTFDSPFHPLLPQTRC